MPLEYAGTLSEHLACRNSCAMFDVSHLGTVRLSDSGAADRVQNTLTNNLHKIHPGRAQYTHLLNEAGGVLDDIIIWWHENGTIDVMPNASNTSSVQDALGGDDITQDRAVIAVQGPTAKEVASLVCSALAMSVGSVSQTQVGMGSRARSQVPDTPGSQVLKSPFQAPLHQPCGLLSRMPVRFQQDSGLATRFA